MRTSHSAFSLRALALISLLISLIGSAVFVTPAHAATFTVTDLYDSGAGTLRQAILDANATAGADTITFSLSGTIPVFSTLPTITAAGGALTIDGTGQTVTISGLGGVGVLYVDTGASLTLNNLTIADGNANSSYGGGVLNYGGALTIANSTFSGNSAYSGGGVFNYYGSLTITNTTFSGNSTTGGQGGGIYSNGTLTIISSTFSGNSTTGVGVGGAIYSDAAMTISNTIVANSASGGNCGGGPITNGGNNIEDSTSCGWGSTSGSMSNTDPLLDALADHGGPTQTFALLTGSPAIDGLTFGAPNSAPSTDQRGVARPQGVRYDIGAFELNQQSGPNFIVNALADTDGTVCEEAPPGDCTLREAINTANALAGANTITFSLSGTITLGSTLPTITAPGGALTLDGTGQSVIISGNNAVRVAIVDASASLTLNDLTIANGNPGLFGNEGGGIYNNGTLNITDSTFSGNSAGGISLGGGAIFNNGGTTIITNSAFSGNGAGIYGGGILNKGTLIVTSSTFSGNSAGSAGGGIYSWFTGTTVTLRNTIVANSTGGNCAGTITDGGNNIDSGTTCGWDSTSGSMSTTDPKLGALSDNGGPTLSFALLLGSPAINGVTSSSPNGAPSTDQRGVARPQGVRYDIGAFESEAQAGPGYIVNVSTDTDDGFCDFLGQGLGNEDCTLREAINAANALADANTITFSLSDTITLGSTLPNIAAAGGALTIDGTGKTVTIDGNNAVLVMQVEIGASLALTNLTIANGYVYGRSGIDGSGGGIMNYGTLAITNSTFSGNRADIYGGGGGGVMNIGGALTITNSSFYGNSALAGYGGGGVYNQSGTLNIANSSFYGNSAGIFGGGIYNSGTLNITNSVFSGNRGMGGGIYNDSTGTTTVTKSTFVGNIAGGSTGGGIHNHIGTLTITNSTFSGNFASVGGGGIYNDDTTTITNSTFSGNSATNGSGISNNVGTLTLRNTIVANSISGGNCAGTITNGGNNIDDGATCGWFSASGSMSGTNPNLGALANNGGPTQTFALLTGSPAIDGVTYNAPNNAPSTDQRGVARPRGVRYDIGSFESVGLYRIYLPLVLR